MEVIKFLKESRLFGHLSEETLKELVPLSGFQAFNEGEYILKEGQENDRVYFLIRGKAAIRSGKELILVLKRTGDIFGEMSIISNKPCSASVIAETKVDAFTIRARDIGKYTDLNGDSLQNILFRLFSLILTDKLALTTTKAQQFESVNQSLKDTQKKLEEAYQNSLSEIIVRKNIEKELDKAKEDAEQANRSKSAFLANMSHEIRTSVNGVVGMNNLMLSSKLSPEQHYLAEVINKSTHSLLSVIDDILDYSKIDSGDVQLRIVDFNPGEIVQELIDLLSIKANEKGIRFYSQIDPASQLQLKGDPVRLRQILLNLASNSIKFTEKGEVVIQISVKNETAIHSRLRFSVSDTGVGIPEDEIKQLFTVFSQGDSTLSRKYSETGLGLTISKQLAKLMNSEIQVESNVNKGSKFWLDLEFEKSDLSLEPAFADPPNEKSSSSDSEKSEEKKPVYRILVVEDDAINQRVIMMTLENLGYDAKAINNGMDAVDILKTESFGLVLMDIQMPVMDGFQATRLIRDPATGTKNPTIPIIAFTAHASSEYQKKCLAAGMNEHLSKPFQTAVLDKLLRRWLNSSTPENTGIQESQNKCLDRNTLDVLRRDVGDEFDNLMRMFISELSEKLEVIDDAIGKKDNQSVNNMIHKLKSNCATFGAYIMVDLCKQLKISVENEITSEAFEIFKKLKAESEHVIRLLVEEERQ